jgi:hypothetical protein
LPISETHIPHHQKRFPASNENATGFDIVVTAAIEIIGDLGPSRTEFIDALKQEAVFGFAPWSAANGRREIIHPKVPRLARYPTGKEMGDGMPSWESATILVK